MGTFCLSWVGGVVFRRAVKKDTSFLLLLGFVHRCNGIFLFISSDEATRPSRKPVYKGTILFFLYISYDQTRWIPSFYRTFYSSGAVFTFLFLFYYIFISCLVDDAHDRLPFFSFFFAFSGQHEYFSLIFHFRELFHSIVQTFTWWSLAAIAEKVVSFFLLFYLLSPPAIAALIPIFFSIERGNNSRQKQDRADFFFLSFSLVSKIYSLFTRSHGSGQFLFFFLVLAFFLASHSRGQSCWLLV